MPGLCKLLKSLGYLGQLRCGLRQEVPWFKSRLSNWIRIGVWESSPPIAEFFYIYYTDLHPEVIAMLTGCYLEWYMMLDGKKTLYLPDQPLCLGCSSWLDHARTSYPCMIELSGMLSCICLPVYTWLWIVDVQVARTGVGPPMLTSPIPPSFNTSKYFSCCNPPMWWKIHRYLYVECNVSNYNKYMFQKSANE
jgi:hypothetical protein